MFSYEALWADYWLTQPANNKNVYTISLAVVF